MGEQEYQQRIDACVSALYRVARSILFNEQDCADAIQEAIFQGWLKRGQLRDKERFRFWIMRIVINECHNMQRQMFKQRKAVEAAVENLRQPLADTANLEAALSMLPEKYRLPIVLHYMEGYSTKEIAFALGTSPERIRDRMRSGRKMLGRMMDHGEE